MVDYTESRVIDERNIQFSLRELLSRPLEIDSKESANQRIKEYEAARQLVEAKILAGEHTLNEKEQHDIKAFLAALEYVRSQATTPEGLMLSYVWLDDLVAGERTGQHIDIDTFMPESEAFAESLKAAFPEACLVVTPNVEFEEKAMGHDLRDYYTARFGPNAEVDDFVVLSTEHRAELAEVVLLPLLKTNDPESIWKDDDGALYWRPNQSENPLAFITQEDGQFVVLPGILLRNPNGEWTDEALEAASYLDIVNTDSQRIFVRPQSQLQSRDKTWEIIRSLGVPNATYHEVFYEDNADQAELAASLSQLITKEKDKAPQEHPEAHLTGWDSFDPLEYVSRNYGESILPEDKVIITTVINALRELGVEPHSISHMADIGAGPNIYTTMLLAPYLADDAVVQLLEYSPKNREYLKWFKSGETAISRFAPLKGTWNKFQQLMTEQDPRYQGSVETIRKHMSTEFADMRNLEAEQFEAACAFFVTDSYAKTDAEFSHATHKIIESVKPGGIFVMAHMVESEGYFAGEGKHNATKMSFERIKAYYDLLLGEGNYTIEYAVDEEEKAREGYHGMAVVVGKRPVLLPSASEMLSWVEQN